MTQKDEINHVTSHNGTPNNTVEDENQKQTFSRTKRNSTALDSCLSKIQENEEGKRDDLSEHDEEESVAGNSEKGNKNIYKSSSFSIFQTEVEYEETEVLEKDNEISKTERKRSKLDTVSSNEIVSQKSAESVCVKDTQKSIKCVFVKDKSNDAKVDEKRSNHSIETNVTKQSSPSRHHSCSESRKSSLSSIPKLEIRNSGRQINDLPPAGQGDEIEQRRSRSISTSSSNDVKLPNVKCVHSNGIHIGEKVGRTVKWRTEKDNCTLCQVPDEMIRNAQEQANKLLLDIVYPHEFYDKFSRARNSKKSNLNQSTVKDTISICKPAKVTRKIAQPEKVWNRIPVQNNSISRVPEENGVMQYSTVPEKRRKQETSEEAEHVKKDIHVQCKARSKAMVITDDEKGQKMVLKGLKGWLLKKHEDCKNKLHIDLRQSLYQVSTLGMQFSLPEYNTSLHVRKPQSPRPVTSVTARSLDNGSVLRHANNIGQRQRTMPSIPRDLYQGQSRGFGALQRDLTTMPARIPSTVSEISPRHVLHNSNLNSSITNSSHKNLENAIAKVLKTGLSLPPISSDIKTPVSIGQSPT